jgi:hypothetical protein
MGRFGVLMALPEADLETMALNFCVYARPHRMGLDRGWQPADGRPLGRPAIWNQCQATAALQHETQMIPIVFAVVGDPVGSGFVRS